MNHERDHSHAHTTSSSHAGDHADLEPGQASRSARLHAPDHPIASGLVQRQRDGNGVAADAEHAVAAASSSSGTSLPTSLMRKFESSLGADLSGVRVHTGEASASAAQAVGAKAYTVGQDIHFGAGHYEPSSPGGEHLIAHEVAHTVQQAGGAQRRQYKLEVSSPGDSFEHEADRAADAMVSGRAASVGSAAGGLAREAKEVPHAAPPVKGGDIEVEILKRSFGEKEVGPLSLEPKMTGKIVLKPAGHGAAEKKPEGKEGEGKAKEAHPVEIKGGASKEGVKLAAEKEFGEKTWGFQPKLASEVELSKDGIPKVKVGVALEHEGWQFGEVKVGPLTGEGTAFKWEKGQAAPTIATFSIKLAFSTKSKTPYFGYDVLPTLEGELEVKPNWKEIASWIAKRAAAQTAAGAGVFAAALGAPAVAAAAMLYAWAKAGHEFDETHGKIESLRAKCRLAADEAVTGKHTKVVMLNNDLNVDATAMAAKLRATICNDMKIPEGALEAAAKADKGLAHAIYLKAWGQAWPGLKAQLLDLYKDTTFTSNKFARDWLNAFDKGET